MSGLAFELYDMLLADLTGLDELGLATWVADRRGTWSATRTAHGTTVTVTLPLPGRAPLRCTATGVSRADALRAACKQALPDVARAARRKLLRDALTAHTPAAA